MKWTSRKLISAWGLTILASYLVTNGGIDSGAWSGFMSVIWLAYFAANHMDKRVN